MAPKDKILAVLFMLREVFWPEARSEPKKPCNVSMLREAFWPEARSQTKMLATFHPFGGY